MILISFTIMDTPSTRTACSGSLSIQGTLSIAVWAIEDISLNVTDSPALNQHAASYVCEHTCVVFRLVTVTDKKRFSHTSVESCTVPQEVSCT